MRRLLLACVLGAMPIAAAQAEGGQVVPDLLDRPALHSERAAQAVTLSVARAGDRLVAVGEMGTVLLSDDNGASWTQAESVPVSVALTDVTFVSDAEGWAVGHGGVVLHSSDAGNTWTRQLDGRTIGDIAVAEAQARVSSGAEGADKLLGDAELLIDDGPDKPLLSVYFADAKNGWTVGAYGLALHTTDGGETWQAVMGRIPNDGGYHLNAIVPSAGGLIIAGELGHLFASTDGGASFQAVDSDYEGSWFGALALGQQQLLAYGLRGNAWVRTAAPSVPADMSGDMSMDMSTDAAADATAAPAPADDWRQLDMGAAATLTSALPMDGGDFLLVDEGAKVFRGRAAGASAQQVAQAPVPGVTDMVLTADGALVLASLRGPFRLSLDESSATAGGQP